MHNSNDLLNTSFSLWIASDYDKSTRKTKNDGPEDEEITKDSTSMKWDKPADCYSDDYAL